MHMNIISKAALIGLWIALHDRLVNFKAARIKE